MFSLPDFKDARFATATLYRSDGYRVVGFAFRAGQDVLLPKEVPQKVEAAEDTRALLVC